MCETCLAINGSKLSKQDVQTWTDHIHRKYRKWIGLAKSAEGSILYRSNEHSRLNFKDLGQMQKQLEVVKWHIMKYSKDPQSQELYRYRLRLDRKGHIGRGNPTSPCLTLENLERSRELERSSSAGQHGHRGLGFQYRYRRVEPREEVIERLKKKRQKPRDYLYCINTKCKQDGYLGASIR